MSPFLGWVGLVITALIAGLSAGLGFWQGLPAQTVILYTAATFALVLWLWQHVVTLGSSGTDPDSASAVQSEAYPSARAAFRKFLSRNKGLLLALLLLFAVFLIASVTVAGFFTGLNVVALLILIALLVFAVRVSKFFVNNRSAFIGLTVLVGLFAISSFTIEGFASIANIKAMLVFASFLGLACVGQTFVALLGGLDLSIPFIIGSSNVGLLYLIKLGVPSGIALIVILLLGAFVGFVNGVLSIRVQGQALILTLGVGFVISGLTQILTSIGSAQMGNVYARVPDWLRNLAAMNGQTFGLDLPPIILIWAAVAALLIYGLKNTVYGRYLYALGGNRICAGHLMISEGRYWVGTFTVSGLFSAFTGSLLLGWSGGGFIGVGESYLFMTLAAVVIGGTSLLGGYGGYGFTVIGVLVLQVLTSFLVGIGLKFEWQQFIFGLLILPMVALYARSAHIRTQV